MGKVKAWRMSEDERQAYIKRYPIRQQPEQVKNFDTKVDYRWPATKKAKAAR